MTGWAWIAEQGLLASPICITNTHAVGVVRDAICRLRGRSKVARWPWLLPVVAETYDGWLSDADELPAHAGSMRSLRWMAQRAARWPRAMSAAAPA